MSEHSLINFPSWRIRRFDQEGGSKRGKAKPEQLGRDPSPVEGEKSDNRKEEKSWVDRNPLKNCGNCTRPVRGNAGDAICQLHKRAPGRGGDRHPSIALECDRWHEPVELRSCQYE